MTIFWLLDQNPNFAKLVVTVQILKMKMKMKIKMRKM